MNIYNLQALKDWPEPGKKRYLAIIGDPVAHTRSPALHKAALAKLALEDPGFADWDYVPFHIKPKELDAALALLLQKGFVGLNVTLPYKEAVLKNPLVRPANTYIEKLGASNTLVAEKDHFTAHNTDCFGFEAAVIEAFGDSIFQLPCLVLGAGGAARAALAVLLERNCPEIWVANRSEFRFEALRKLVPDLKTITLGQPLRQMASGFGLCVNTMTLGVGIEAASPLFTPGGVLKGARIYDMNYGESRFSIEAQSAGFPTVTGSSMLAMQAKRALELWTGRIQK